MREKFICTHFVTSCIAKSAVKPIFSPLPHPTFFTPKSPFSRFSPFRTRFRAIFRGIALVFCPAKPTFFSSFLILGPTSDDFARDLTLYYRHTSLFAQREGFFISCFPHSSRPAPPSSPDLLPFRSSSPTLFPPPPLSFSFLPTFPSPSPITARTRALSRTTRVRVHTHTPTRQEVFVYCLHRFTHLPQSTVHQRVRGEAKREKAFTKYTTASQSEH